MPTQAEVWLSLRLDWRSVAPLGRQDFEAWLAKVNSAVQPKTYWEEMLYPIRSGTHARITRVDFPDASTLIAVETWRKQPLKDCEMDEKDIWRAPVTWRYELQWIPLPIR